MTGRPSSAIADALRAGRSGIGDDLHREGRVIVTDLQASISEPYPPASAPGEPPHLRTGDLRHSYVFDVTQSTAVVWVLEVGSPLDYAVYTEFGTRYMAPRPHLRPCITRNYTTLQATLREGIEQRERTSV